MFNNPSLSPSPTRKLFYTTAATTARTTTAATTTKTITARTAKSPGHLMQKEKRRRNVQMTHSGVALQMNHLKPAEVDFEMFK